MAHLSRESIVAVAEQVSHDDVPRVAINSRPLSAPSAMGRCCQLNLREEYTRQRRLKERRSKPQPWIVRKLTVAIALALLAYLCYVYLARLCLPAIRRSHSIASRPLAIAFLVVFSLLAALTLWSYYKVCLI